MNYNVDAVKIRFIVFFSVSYTKTDGRKQINVHSQLRQVMNSKNKFSIRKECRELFIIIRSHR